MSNSYGLSFSGALGGLLGRNTIRWAILITAVLLLLFAHSGQERIYGDAIRYSGEARAMADSGEYATLRFGQEPNHHGPLLFWLTAAAIKLLGPTPFAATLFSRLFGLACVVLTAYIGADWFEEKTAWLAALALAANYTFFRNTTTLRMDSALTFGTLVALAGYWRGQRRWGPPVFYAGVAIAILAKSVAGFLPLVIAGTHAAWFGRVHLPWHKQSRRWISWSLLLLVPLAWWTYLSWRYGASVFSSIISDLQEGDHSAIYRLHEFFKVYVLGFGMSYILWLPFAAIGTWLAARDLADRTADPWKRDVFGFLLVWIGVVFLSSGLKPGEYERYLMPALPAISLLAATAILHLLKKRIPIWIAGALAGVTITAAIAIACLPGSQGLGETEKLSAIGEILDRRLPPHSSVPVIKLNALIDINGKGAWDDEGRCRFFFGRDARLVSVAEAREAAAHGLFTAIVPKKEYRAIAASLHLDPLVQTRFWILAEVTAQNQNEISPPKSPGIITKPARLRRAEHSRV